MSAPTLAEAARVWARIGVLSFGGPAAQIALMHRAVVEEKGWLSEQRFLDGLNFCMLLPGPEAMQLATYTGWRLHGMRGGLVAGLLFVLPGAAVILALALLYLFFGSVPLVQALFLGVKAAVLIIVIEALLKVSRRAMKGPVHWALAGLAFLALFALSLPYPLVILLAGVIGALALREAPSLPVTAPVSLGQTLRTAVIWLAVWLAPVGILLAMAPGHILTELAAFFSLLATLTFGGAYAVLAWLAQDAVELRGWLSNPEMIDALGLAETTPGPLILVTEFVGILAAARDGGSLSVPMGIAGGVVTLWVTFAPCFLWVFMGAPWIERLSGLAWLRAALSGVTAAVVGVILSLSLWFALSVGFGTLREVTLGPVALDVPVLATFDWRVLVIAGVAGAMLLWRHLGVGLTLAVSALLGLALGQI